LAAFSIRVWHELRRRTMSMTKARIEMEEQQRMEAEDMLVEFSALTRCWMHPDVVFDHGVVDLESAFRRANAKFSRGEVRSFRTRREMTDAMQKVHREAAMECWQHEKLLDD
jgi:hypothetical protein